MDKVWKIGTVILIVVLIVTLLFVTLGIILKIKNDNNGETISTSTVKDDSQENIKDINLEETNVKQERTKVNAKELIRIQSITTSQPNSVGGVDLSINWTNMSDKTIKYITFTAYPVNSVNDIVYSEINPYAQGQFKGKETGPIEKGKGSKAGYVYSNAWYNNTIVKAILMQVDIEYMDGTKISLSGSNLNEAIY